MSRSNEAKKLADFAPKLGSKYAMDWDDYHDHDTLNDFIAALADANEWASIIPIGESYEGRKMNVLAITKAGPGAPNIWIEAGIHAREWISPAVASFIIRELVEDYAEHPSYIDNINWYYLPSGNNHSLDQGCISCGILVSGIGARGVSSEHMENMEMFSCSPT